jgi:serine O-acetyltransferase
MSSNIFQEGPDAKFVSTVWDQLHKEANFAVQREPLLKPLIDEAVLRHSSFGESLRFRLATKLGGRLVHSNDWLNVFEDACCEKQDYTIMRDACHDLIAILKRDPACDSILTAFLFFKGYKALQSYRFAHVFWLAGRKELALLLQSRISEVFAVDIHPGAKLGRGVMLDHATGLVIGETSVVGDDCSFLHGVTLGGTGKVSGDRHPKIGNNVVIGCNASVLGNIVIGDNCKIGSGTIVVKSMLPGTTAVGTPARLIEPKEPSVDNSIHQHNFSTLRRHYSTSVTVGSKAAYNVNFASRESRPSLIDIGFYGSSTAHSHQVGSNPLIVPHFHRKTINFPILALRRILSLR